MYSKLQYISQGLTAKEQLENIQRTLDAGGDWIQLRFKNSDEKEFYSVAQKIKTLCKSYSAVFIINDNVHIAESIDADGVHLGLQDMPVIKARSILGGDKIIGGTANTLNDVLTRINEKCDYIGLGPLRFTSTKNNLSPVLGLDGYKNIMNEVVKNKAHTPIYAVGGVVMDDIRPLLKANVYGIAVSGAITNDSNKKELLKRFNLLLHEKINNC